MVNSLIEWCMSGVVKKFAHVEEFSYDSQYNFGDVLFSFIGPIYKLHASQNLNLGSFYWPENQYISSLILASLTWHSQVQVQCQALELLATSRPHSLSKLSFFLHSCNNYTQETQSFVFSHIIPLLVSVSKDPFIVMSSINSVFLLDDHGNRIAAMYRIWNTYPRIWPKFRSLLGSTLQKYKLAAVKENQIETALTGAIRFQNIFNA
jgi:hypothetical protein